MPGITPVRQWRERLGLTQMEAALAIGYSLSRFCVYDQGKKIPPFKMLCAMRGVELEKQLEAAA